MDEEIGTRLWSNKGLQVTFVSISRYCCMTAEDITAAAHEAITLAMLQLLESRHLYQSVYVDFSGVNQIIENESRNAHRISALGPGNASGHISQELYKSLLSKGLTSLTESFWNFQTEEQPLSKIAAGIPAARVHHASIGNVALPTIKINCANCDASKPAHNSGYKGMVKEICYYNFHISKGERVVPVQVFAVPYLCQSCKIEPLIFTIRRENLKLQLVGRSHFERIDIPKSLSKEQEAEFFSEAIIANNAGRVLAGLFFLRLFIEQYMRRITSNSATRITGEDLSDQYAKFLDPEFPKKFASLKTIYEELSICLHKASGDAQQFDKSVKDIEKHFDLLTHFPLISKP